MSPYLIYLMRTYRRGCSKLSGVEVHRALYADIRLDPSARTPAQYIYRNGFPVHIGKGY